MNQTNIRVVSRFRPLNTLEKSLGGEVCVKLSDKNVKIQVKEGDKTDFDFAFDSIFGPDTEQQSVFDVAAKPVIDGVMNGCNGTILVYGQTSSGKTWTMEGPSIDSTDNKGIIPRMMDYVFQWIFDASENLEFTVKCSFLEIYNEKIQDLLDPKKNNLAIKEDKTKGIHVHNSTEVCVDSVESMKSVMHRGQSNRTVAATRMNENSSRSHSIFVVSIYQKDLEIDTTKASKLYLVDLAGSEKVGKTNVKGQQLEEAKNINKSLTTLGMVINALTSDKKEHIPYRDSKLTRLLQESLGGNASTTLIINASMCSYNDKETLSTLRFGMRAKSIKNKPIVNEEKSAKELQILLTKAEKKMRMQEELIAQLQSATSVNVTSTLNLDMPKIPLHQAVESLVTPRRANPNDKLEDNNQDKVTLYKKECELSTIKESFETLQVKYGDLEADLTSKNNEIQELKQKLNGTHEAYSDTLNQQLQLITKYQEKLDGSFKFLQDYFSKCHLVSTRIQDLKAEIHEVYIEQEKNKAEEKANELIFHIAESFEAMKGIEKSFEEQINAFLEIKDEISSVNDEMMSKSIESPPNSIREKASPSKFSGKWKEQSDISTAIGEKKELTQDEEKEASPMSKSEEEEEEREEPNSSSLIEEMKLEIRELKAFKEQLHHLETLHEELKAKLKSSQSRAENLEKMMEEKNLSFTDFHEEMRVEMNHKNALIEELQNEINRLKSLFDGDIEAEEIIGLQEKNTGLSLENTHLNSELTRLREESEKNKAQLKEKEERLVVLLNHVNFLKNDLDKFKMVQRSELLKPRVFEEPDEKKSSWLKKHIVKTIRGGGGGITQYMKDKFRRSSDVQAISSARDYRAEGDKRKISAPVNESLNEEEIDQENPLSSDEEKDVNKSEMMEKKFKTINTSVSQNKEKKKTFGSFFKKILS